MCAARFGTLHLGSSAKISQDISSRFTDPMAENQGEVTSVDLQTLHSRMDLLIRASHVLQSNLLVLKALEVEARKRQHLQQGTHTEDYSLFHDALISTTQELGFLINRVDLVRARLTNITEAVRRPGAMQYNLGMTY